MHAVYRTSYAVQLHLFTLFNCTCTLVIGPMVGVVEIMMMGLITEMLVWLPRIVFFIFYHGVRSNHTLGVKVLLSSFDNIDVS